MFLRISYSYRDGNNQIQLASEDIEDVAEAKFNPNGSLYVRFNSLAQGRVFAPCTIVSFEVTPVNNHVHEC